jgi:hypothetical protein
MVVVFFGPVLFTHRIPMLWDLWFFFYPGYVAFREAVMQDALPLWNP